MTITTETIRTDIFKEFMAVLQDNLTFDNLDISPAFDEKVISKNQVVLKMPLVDDEITTLGRAVQSNKRDGSIDIDIFTTSIVDLMTLTDKVEKVIKDNLDDLSVHTVSIGGATDNTFDIEGKFVHTTTVPISFRLRLFS